MRTIVYMSYLTKNIRDGKNSTQYKVISKIIIARKFKVFQVILKAIYIFKCSKLNKSTKLQESIKKDKKEIL